MLSIIRDIVHYAHGSDLWGHRNFWKEHGLTRLLAVDDEEVVCRNIQIAMEGTDVTVDYALDGESALERVKQAERDGKPYHIALVDWKMPGMDGLETARCIRRDVPENVPILILISYDWPEDDGGPAWTRSCPSPFSSPASGGRWMRSSIRTKTGSWRWRPLSGPRRDSTR